MDSYEMQPETEGDAGWMDAPGGRSSAVTAPRLTAEEMKAAYSLIERIGGGSPVRTLAETLLENPQRPLASLQPLIHTLIRPNRSSWHERQLAAWVLGRAPLNAEQHAFASETLAQILEGRLETDTFTEVKRGAIRTLWLGIPAAFFIFQANWWIPPPIAYLQGIAALILPVLIATWIIDQKHSARIRATAATALGRRRDPLGLDALAAALYRSTAQVTNPPVVREAAAKALPAVLSSLTSDYYGRIRGDTMQNLCRALNHPDGELAVAVLRALAYVGDNRALPQVQKLASGGGRAAKDNHIRDTARACLQLIQSRIAQESQSEILLRPAVSPETPPEVLLRPASAASVTDPIQLLRSAVQEQASPSDQETELILAILGDLERSGDSRALPYVEQIAANELTSPRIRQAARSCLPSLRAHAELERYTRPSFLSEDISETMGEVRLRREGDSR